VKRHNALADTENPLGKSAKIQKDLETAKEIFEEKFFQSRY
jgi:hypothetical protein